MRRIEIKNFGPITFAKVDIMPINILIGEQATGKSTIAQCVHLFLSLGEDLLAEIPNINKRYIKESILNIVRSKFYAYYGSSKYLETFDIKFFYNAEEDKYIHIRPIENKTVVSFSDAFELDRFCKELKYILESTNLSYKQKEINLQEEVSSFLMTKTGIDVSSVKYFIAGRNITTSYSEAFKSYFSQNYRHITRLGGRNIPKSAQMELTRDFILYSAEMKDLLSAFGGSFEELFEENNTPQNFIKDFISRTVRILKGKYIISKSGDELIKISYGKHISLHFASSGQQESIRILQDLSLQCAFVEDAFRTIEEPEAHLFPSAQNALTELIVMTHNRTGSSFFLTTHSPYFLSSFNNLLYAAKAAGDNTQSGGYVEEDLLTKRVKKVEQLGYSKHLRLASKHFAAYQLMSDGTVEVIYNFEDAITKIDGLDAVSDEIAHKFESLVEIVKNSEHYEEA